MRPATRTWLGAGSPSAAATNDGAAIAPSESTAQSLNSVRIRAPSEVFDIRMTRRAPGLSSCTRNAAWMLPTSLLPTSATARAASALTSRNASSFSSSASCTFTRGSRAICGPWLRFFDGRMTATSCR